MQDAGRYRVRDPRPESYPRYLQAVAGFVDWLLSQGYDVRLLLGDGDVQVISEFRSVLRARLGEYEEERVVDEPIDTVENVLAQLAATDFVVATRFHNVLLALLLGKPVVAISFHHKCSSLMAELGLAEYCREFERIDAETLIERFQALELNAGDVRRTVRDGARAARATLEEQYDLLFGAAG
jgi:polysaccharide pyruvyl transferase WcaK-like protein